MTSVVIGKVGDIPPGERKIVVPFRGRAGIGVFNVNGSFYAVRNICPHKNGPLCTGELSGRVTTDVPPSTRGPQSPLTVWARCCAVHGISGHSTLRPGVVW